MAFQRMDLIFMAVSILVPIAVSANGNGVRTKAVTDSAMTVENQLNQVPQIQIQKNQSYENARKGEAGAKAGAQYTAIMSNVMQIGGSAALTAGMMPCGTPAGCNYGLIGKGTALLALGALFQKDSQTMNTSAGNMRNLQNDLGGGKGVSNGPFDRELKATEERANKALGDLKKLGFQVNGDGSIKTPDGKLINSESASDPSSLGISPDAMAQAQSEANRQAAILDSTLGERLKEAMAALNSEVEAGNLANGLESVSGGAGALGVAGEGDGGADIYGSLQAMQRRKAEEDRKVASELKGLSQKYGDSFIGVEQDNIFMMIHRFYDVNRHEYTDN